MRGKRVDVEESSVDTKEIASTDILTAIFVLKWFRFCDEVDSLFDCILRGSTFLYLQFTCPGGET